ncbi:MAG TPA: hypothetical protein DIT10_11720 [Chryseobacterium sp.]|uniref:hypothetical protein n=1 Tax=Chryseobacterium lactis TaxID=1241981 RepID=UPI00063D38A6|nr:hypothetical protein [Chryseobacterium lactis]HCN49740.1 hypothetical protein [Chryseobacterium sp.]
MDDKGYYFYDRNQSISISEHDLVGKEMDEIEGFFSTYPVDRLHPTERIYVLKKCLFGMIKLKLHLYLNEDTVYDYSIKM